MEPEGSLPHSQIPATCPYPEPARSSPHPPHLTSWRSILILSSHLRLGLPTCLFHSGFTTKTLYTPLLYPLRAAWSSHLFLLDLITRTIFGEQYRSLSSSLCSFLHSPVTSSFLGPNIPLNTLFSNTPGMWMWPVMPTYRPVTLLPSLPPYISTTLASVTVYAFYWLNHFSWFGYVKCGHHHHARS